MFFFPGKTFSKLMIKLSQEKELELKNLFLKSLGRKIRVKREKKNISLEILAQCLGISISALSKYENGNEAMKVSYLPLISTYCDFPITEYFDKEQAQMMVDTFSKLVKITRRKYERTIKNIAPVDAVKKEYIDGKEVRGYIILDDDGEERRIEKGDFSVDKMVKEPSLRERYTRGEMPAMETPFSQKEFMEYLEGCADIALALDGVNKLLDFIGNTPQKETIKCQLAEYIIKEVIIDPVLNNENIETQKAYAYYKSLLEEKETDI